MKKYIYNNHEAVSNKIYQSLYKASVQNFLLRSNDLKRIPRSLCEKKNEYSLFKSKTKCKVKDVMDEVICLTRILYLLN